MHTFKKNSWSAFPCASVSLWWVLPLVLVVASLGHAEERITFRDVTAQAGIHFTHNNGAFGKKWLPETMGPGCAFIDYDNDGWMDIFLLCGTRLEGAPAEATNRLYKNNRDGTFTDVTEKAGLHAVGWACGVCIGDYNNDGFEDIFCTYF